MLKGLIGRKIGMTQIFDDQGVAYPVTLIEAGPCYVTQVRKPEKEGYSAVQLGFSEVHPKRLTNGQLGHLTANKIPAFNKNLTVSSVGRCNGQHECAEKRQER